MDSGSIQRARRGSEPDLKELVEDVSRCLRLWPALLEHANIATWKAVQKCDDLPALREYAKRVARSEARKDEGAQQEVPGEPEGKPTRKRREEVIGEQIEAVAGDAQNRDDDYVRQVQEIGRQALVSWSDAVADAEQRRRDVFNQPREARRNLAAASLRGNLGAEARARMERLRVATENLRALNRAKRLVRGRRARAPRILLELGPPRQAELDVYSALAGKLVPANVVRDALNAHVRDVTRALEREGARFKPGTTGDPVDRWLRREVWRLFMLSHADVELLRAESPEARALFRPRRGSAARNARRRPKK